MLKKPLPPVFDPAAIDHSVEPCVDFYQYAHERIGSDLAFFGMATGPGDGKASVGR